MTSRRDFIKQAAAAGIALSLPETLFGGISVERAAKDDENFIWASLLHLSYNMWEDNTPPGFEAPEYTGDDCREAYLWAHKYHPHLTFDKAVWDQLLVKMSEAGMNMLIIDLGDGVRYESHPEIAVKGAWTTGELKRGLKKIRKMGIEPIPKLNFSTGHKAWLGPYQRMISSDTYYAVCKNLIEEVIQLFDSPRFFHLGMDEETAGHQRYHENVVVRQGNLWWHDLYYLVDVVEKQNVRSWIWSDYAWNYPEDFFAKMPKTVLQSNWYYGSQFDNFDNPTNETYVKLYDQLEAHGYDQVPAGGNHSNNVNFGKTVEYCTKVIAPDRLKGFLQTIWRPTLPACFERHCEAIDQVGSVIQSFKNK